MGIISILLCTKIFPWFALQNTPLNIIQAPWRFMIFSTCSYLFSISIYFSTVGKIFLYKEKKFYTIINISYFNFKLFISS